MKTYSLIVVFIAMLLVSCQKASDPVSVQEDISYSVSQISKSASAAATTRYLDEIFPTVTITSNIAYSQSMDENGQMQTHFMDIYQPDGDTELQRPVIVWAPGGGFNNAVRTNTKIVDYATTFAMRGYVTTVIDYRVREHRQFVGTEPDFPQVVREAQYDGQAAVRWFRANASQYKIDVNRICIGGLSAGAFVALDVTYNYEDTGDNTSNSGYPSNTAAAVDMKGAMLDVTMMQSGDPPVIIFHGTADPRVPYSEALKLQTRAQAVGVTHELNAYQGADHDLYPAFRDDIVAKTANFLFTNVIGGNIPTDVVNIIKADYKDDKQELNVEATSTMSPNAVLTLEGFGTMQYDAKKDKYKMKVKGINNPGTVTVTSSCGGSDTATLPGASQSPVAKAGPDQTVTDADGDGFETVTLDGSGSSDADGTITAYEWKEGATVLGTTAIISPNLALGSHTITLTVTDNSGNTGSDNVVVTVNANQAPVANAGPDQTVGDGDANGFEIVTLDGSGSSDADGAITAYEWKEGATVLGTTAIISPNLALGSHTITLTVTDNSGTTGSDNVIVTVNANQAPVANAGPDQSANVGDNVSFDASGSFDPVGTIVSYGWDFGDGATASGSVVSHAYSATGTYTVTLTVTDNGGLTAQDIAIVAINDVSADVVQIIKAEWDKKKRKLKVEATSTMSPNAVLTAVGFGTMQYDAKKNKYKLNVSNVSSNPGTVTVTSSLGGSDTATVTVK